MRRLFKPVLGAIVLALSCAGAARGDDRPPAREPDIVGTINQVMQDRISIGTGKKPVVRLTQNTRILTDRPVRKRLEAGQKVRVWLEEPGSDAALIIQVYEQPGRSAPAPERTH